MGTIFLVYVHCGPKSVGGITWAKRALAQSQYWAVKSDQCHPYYSFRVHAKHGLKRNVHLEMRNLKQTERRTEERKAEDTMRKGNGRPQESALGHSQKVVAG